MDSPAFALYSPLFTSGLLSGRNTPELDDPSPSCSRPPSTKHRRQKDNHDSFPLTVNTVSFHAAVRDSASGNAMFLTLMPRRRWQEDDEGRSFLSLDLAESQSMRSMSLRRKDTVTTRATRFFASGSSEPASPLCSPTPRLPELTFSQFGVPPIAPKPMRRSSRETLNLPLPKPAPSASLPELPLPLHRRAASKLKLSLSTSISSTASSTSPGHRYSHSAPPLLSPPLCSSPMLSPGQSYFLFSPVSPTEATASLSPPQRAIEAPRSPPASAPASVPLRASPSFRSVASVNTRLRNRSAALAMLEGRIGMRSASAVRPRNFMSMSDDEDEPENENEVEDEENDVQHKLLQVLQEEEDVVMPRTPASASTGIAAVPTPARTKPSSMGASGSSRATRLSRDRESGRESSRWSSSWSGSGSGSSGHRRSRRGTLESFLSPLANFIDLKDDDGSSSRGWRSFVEISS